MTQDCKGRRGKEEGEREGVEHKVKERESTPVYNNECMCKE